jgi:hypothetical protein
MNLFGHTNVLQHAPAIYWTRQSASACPPPAIQRSKLFQPHRELKFSLTPVPDEADMHETSHAALLLNSIMCHGRAD